MHPKRFLSLRVRLAALALGIPFILSSCDPTLQSTVENGLINLSTSFLGSLLQAVLQVASEANA